MQIKNQQITTKQKITIFFNNYFKFILIFCVFVIFLLSYFLFFPSLIKQYSKMNQQVFEEKKSELAKQKDILKELTELNNIYEKISPSLKEKVLNLLPDEIGLANLYYNLDQLAKQSKYEIDKIDVVAPKQKQTKTIEQLEENERTTVLKEVKISIKLDGEGYLNLKEFINLLENNLRIFDIENFNYNSEKSNIELKLRTYYFNWSFSSFASTLKSPSYGG